jgi:hypothetical protein
LDALHLSLFTTNITDELADIVSLLPIFTFAVPDEIPGVVVEVDDDDGDSTNSAQSLKRGSNETFLPPRQEALAKRAFNTQFPLINGISLSDLRFAPPFLTQISNKAGSTVGLADAYLHVANIRGGNVMVHVFDTGFGNGQTAFSGAIVLPVTAQDLDGNTIQLQKCQARTTPLLFGSEQVLMTDEADHETFVADIIVDSQDGVAPNANFVVVKYAQLGCTMTTTSYGILLESILADWKARDKTQFTDAIINISNSWFHVLSNTDWIDAIADFLEPLAAAKMIFVLAAGEAKPSLDNIVYDVNDWAPQAYASLDQDDFPFIIVGSVNTNGVIPARNFEDNDPPEYISLYAQDKVQGIKNNVFQPDTKSGTSLAAPQVAGVLAEWLSLPEIRQAIDTCPDGNFPAKVRSFVRDISLTNNFPGSVNVLYNGYNTPGACTRKPLPRPRIPIPRDRIRKLMCLQSSMALLLIPSFTVEYVQPIPLTSCF